MIRIDLARIITGVIVAGWAIPESVSAQAASKMSCHLVWDTVSEGRSVNDFKYEATGRVSLHKADEVIIEGGERSSKLSIIQKFGKRDEDSIRYFLSCDASLNCQGSRVKTIQGVKTEDPFTFRPASVAIAMIGARDLLEYHSIYRGFSYKFIAYRLPKNNETKGMELNCHE